MISFPLLEITPAPPRVKRIGSPSGWVTGGRNGGTGVPSKKNPGTQSGFTSGS